MYDQNNVPGPEVRIRPVVRYVVTTYYHPYSQVSGDEVFTVPGGSKVVCECENERQADEVANALQQLHDSPIQATKSEKST